MSYSNSFPTQRPSLNLVFNGGSDQLDSRISYTRSSTGTYMSNEKSLNSENLFDKSNVYDSGGWLEVRVDQTIGQTDPSGGTAAKLITQASGQTTAGVVYYTGTFGSDELTFSIYLKPNGRTKPNLSENLTDSGNTVKRTYFDLTGAGAVGTKDAAHTASIAKFGDWYRCTITFTPHAADSGSVYLYISDTDNSQTVADDGNGYIVYGANLSTTGQLITNETSGSIHREFAPTLKTSQSDQPRFEYSATDGQSAAGSPRGLLIEAQSSNLLTYSEDFSNAAYTKYYTSVESNVAMSPTGELTADKLTETTDTGEHRMIQIYSLTSGSSYTISVIAKAAGRNFIRLGAGSLSVLPARVSFDLSNGTIGTVSYGTGAIESLGNGYYRCSVTATAALTSTTSFEVNVMELTNTPSYTGDGYSGVLLFAAQAEQSSSMSSYIKTTSSSATRAADSCSLVSAPLLDNGSGGLTAEYNMRNASATSYVLQTSRSNGGTTQDGVTLFNDGLFILGQGSNTRIGSTTSNVFHKVAASWESGSQKISRDGSAVAEDTTTVVPQSGTDKLHIGTRQDGNASVNGHIRSIAIYSEPLTSTNLTALSQL